MTWLAKLILCSIVVSQTYLVAQITVEQISLNLSDEINSLKLKNFNFRGNRSIFVRTERLNTVVRKFARITKSKLQNKFYFSHSVESEND